MHAYFVKEQPQVDLYRVSELDLKMISDCYVRGREGIFQASLDMEKKMTQKSQNYHFYQLLKTH